MSEVTCSIVDAAGAEVDGLPAERRREEA